jgi:S1 RNA binding domain protein
MIHQGIDSHRIVLRTKEREKSYMQVEIGTIYEGTVKNITKYGAFVEMQQPDGEKFMGMVHISEISRSYVNEIHDFITEGQSVRVKVIGINPQGKISLSMKQLEEAPAQQRPYRNSRPQGQDRGGGNNGEGRSQSFQQAPPQRRGRPNVWEPKKKPAPTEQTFEDMLNRFKQNSEERMCDIKRNTERKNRSKRK